MQFFSYFTYMNIHAGLSFFPSYYFSIFLRLSNAQKSYELRLGAFSSDFLYVPIALNSSFALSTSSSDTRNILIDLNIYISCNSGSVLFHSAKNPSSLISKFVSLWGTFLIISHNPYVYTAAPSSPSKAIRRILACKMGIRLLGLWIRIVSRRVLAILKEK